MKNLKDLINDFDGSNPFPIFFENGYTPESIKQEIIKTFEGYFVNKSNLEDHAINDLATIWLEYLSIGNDKHLVKKLDNTINLIKKALKTNHLLTIETYINWSESLYETINKFWSVKNLQKNGDELCIEDIAENTFQLIGQLIEGLMKPYLKLIYHLNEISQQKVIDKDTINSYDLGKITYELSNLPNLILIQPLNISLSQWRNIAYHHTYSVENGKIKCIYGKGDKSKVFLLTRNKLLEVTKSIYSFFKILKISEALFVFDNLDSIQKHNVKTKNNVKFRDESYLLDFYSGLSSQGFSVKDLIIDDEKSILILQDLLNDDAMKRAIHSSQFLYSLWSFSKSNIIIIEYKKADGCSYLISKTLSKYLKLLDKGKITLNDTLKYIQFDFTGEKTLNDNLENLKKIKDNFNKKDPFRSHLLSAIPTKQEFFSQKGKKITVKEFIKDFILGIFSNYMVFRELGFKKTQVKSA